MSARRHSLEAGGLVIVLFVLTLALGLGLGGVGLSGASAIPGPSNQGSSNQGSSPQGTNGAHLTISPRVIIKAEGINPLDLYDSSSSLVVPEDMYVPLNGLRVTLTQLQRSSFPIRGQLRTQILTTNSAGLAVTFVLPGNYTVLFTGPNFEFDTNIFFASDSITTINFVLNPVAKAVTALSIVSPDSVSGVEPVSKLYALLASSSPPASGFAELVGFNPPSGRVSAHDQFDLNATVLGWYPSTHGLLVALAPLGPYPSYPSLKVVLFQYKPVCEVAYTAA